MPLLYGCSVYLLFGLLIGSFLNVCIYRLPREESIVFPASHCPVCGSQIRWYDNIPVVSFLLLGGKCRFCKNPISLRYPLIELLTGFLFLWSFYWWGFGVWSLLACGLSAVCVAIFVIDWEQQIIPDGLNIALAVLGVVAIFFSPLPWYQHLLGFVVGGGILYLGAIVAEKVLHKEGMGGGDIKFLAAAGLLLGWKMILLALFFGAIASLLVIGIFYLTKQDVAEGIPFGPGLCVGVWTVFFFGQQIIHWYLHLIA